MWDWALNRKQKGPFTHNVCEKLSTPEMGVTSYGGSQGLITPAT